MSHRILAHSGLVSAVLLCTALGALSVDAQAKTGWFLYGGGSTIQTEREDLDELLYPIEIHDRKPGWEAGAGVRFHPGANTEPSLGHPVWELRIRGGLSGGSLEDLRVVFSREDPPIYTAVTTEEFSYSSWNVTAIALARVHSVVGLYAGPGLHRVRFKGEMNRDWDGEIPNFCFDCGDAQGETDETVIYGLFEVGTRLTPLELPAALELFWIPARIPMSSNKILGDDGYNPNFAELNDSWGARLTFDF